MPVNSVKGTSEPELEYLSQILNSFNTRFGDIPWSDKDS